MIQMFHKSPLLQCLHKRSIVFRILEYGVNASSASKIFFYLPMRQLRETQVTGDVTPFPDFLYLFRIIVIREANKHLQPGDVIILCGVYFCSDEE